MDVFEVRSEDVSEAFYEIAQLLCARRVSPVFEEYQRSGVRPTHTELLRWVEYAAPMSDRTLEHFVRSVTSSCPVGIEFGAFVRVCFHLWFRALERAARRCHQLLELLQPTVAVEQRIASLLVLPAEVRIVKVPQPIAGGMAELLRRLGAVPGILRWPRHEVLTYVLVAATALVLGEPIVYKVRRYDALDIPEHPDFSEVFRGLPTSLMEAFACVAKA